MAFPTSPTNGQQANINGITYTYSSAATAWTVSTSVSNTFVSINVSNNVNSGNVLATGVISATGNITGGNVLGGANVNATTHTGTTVSVSANVTGGNLLTGGLISAGGNITGGNLTAGTLTLSGNTISSSDTIITIDPAAAGNTGGVIIQGNLSVTGNVTYIDSNTITTNDLVINMANNAATAAAANGGGIGVGPVTGAYATITYNSTGNIWVISNGANVSGAVSATGNVTGGNLLTGGLISAAGNISANNATFTSNQTLSYGTANGVIYLNSNKVATSGTVLQFDGTNLGLGTTSPSTGKFSDASYAFLIQSASTSTGTNIFASNSDNSKFVGVWSGHSSANSAVGVKSGTALTFGAWSAITGVGGFTEWARFDTSGNLGVGTSSPATKLNVADTSTNCTLTVTNSASNFQVQSNSNDGYFNLNGSGNIIFRSGTPSVTERARIDSSGNFSITQTPGKYTVDVSGGATSIANGGTVDFPSASGMLVVNNWLNGAVTLYLCGGGAVTVVSSVIGSAGSFAYNSGIGGYTWTNNVYGGTATFGFFFVRTRTTA